MTDETKALIVRLLNSDVPPRRSQLAVSNDELTVVLCWFLGEIETRELTRIYSGGPTAAVYRAARVLRDALTLADPSIELMDFRNGDPRSMLRVKGPKEDLRPGDPGYDPAFDIHAVDDDDDDFEGRKN
jgi:hypothetical protein